MGRNGRYISVQAWLLRLSVASLPLILALSLVGLLSPRAQAAPARSGPLRVTVRYHGKTTRTSTSGRTVGELLRQLELELSGEDVVFPGVEEPVTEDMLVQVDRVVTREESYTATLPYDVSHCTDPSIPAGVEETLVQGVDGELLCTARVTYLNGVETGREVLTQQVIRPMVTQLVSRGTGEPVKGPDPKAMPEIGEGYITLPTGEVLTYTHSATIQAAAYTHTDKGCGQITATGTPVRRGTVAVDSSAIPYGTRMFIVSDDGAYIYGICAAEDNGGSGTNRVGLYFPTHDECIQFGRRSCTVYFLG